jgi:hypothetical protein
MCSSFLMTEPTVQALLPLNPFFRLLPETGVPPVRFNGHRSELTLAAIHALRESDRLRSSGTTPAIKSFDKRASVLVVVVFFIRTPLPPQRINFD